MLNQSQTKLPQKKITVMLLLAVVHMYIYIYIYIYIYMHDALQAQNISLRFFYVTCQHRAIKCNIVYFISEQDFVQR